MKKVLLTTMVLVSLAQADTCEYLVKSSLKANDKAKMHYEMGDRGMSKLYLTQAINYMIDAKYECPDELKKKLVKSIEVMKSNLKGME